MAEDRTFKVEMMFLDGSAYIGTITGGTTLRPSFWYNDGTRYRFMVVVDRDHSPPQYMEAHKEWPKQEPLRARHPGQAHE